MMPADLTQELLDMVERHIQENLRDPDLSRRSEEFQAGYRLGMREAIVVFSALLAKKARA